MADIPIYLLHAIVGGSEVHYKPKHWITFSGHFVRFGHTKCAVQHLFTIQHWAVIDRAHQPSVRAILGHSPAATLTFGRGLGP